jgi:centrin-3
MASTAQSHPTFPTRPYSSTLHGKLPERNTASAFGTTSHGGAPRETARHERLQREAQAQISAGSSNPLNALTDEQREEINEAVRPLSSIPRKEADVNVKGSSDSSI